MSKADIGMVGLGVMGQNLVLNMLDHGFKVAVFNRSSKKTTDFLEDLGGRPGIFPCFTLKDLVDHLRPPRILFLMVKAGSPVDHLLDDLARLLRPGDIVVDGGNSHFLDTERRCRAMGDQGIYFVGAGISGGETGARYGPSIMPGGDSRAWPYLSKVLEAICAKVDGEPCCTWIGPGGAGHYVKMVHNGIEYGDMQIVSEAYDLMRRGMGMEISEIADVFDSWNNSELSSYLIEITAKILSFKDRDGGPLIEKILDVSGEKGTGRWTVDDALQKGVPLSLIGEAVFSRYLSRLKDIRGEVARCFGGERMDRKTKDCVPIGLDGLKDALYCSRVICHTQGFMLLKAASGHYGWGLDLSSIASIWRGGCIIRSSMLNPIREAFERNSGLQVLILDDYFKSAIEERLDGWRRTVTWALQVGIPVPAMASSLNYFYGLSSNELPANLIQAMRDYFGAHTYERRDRPGEGPFHTQWDLDRGSGRV